MNKKYNWINGHKNFNDDGELCNMHNQLQVM